MNASKNITQKDIKKCLQIIGKLKKYYSDRIVGQSALQTSLLITIMANGHILLESVPGLAKTTAAKVLTNAVNGKFSRVQCTPDLLPSDIIGYLPDNYYERIDAKKIEYRASYNSTFTYNNASYSCKVISYDPDGLLKHHLISGEFTDCVFGWVITNLLVNDTERTRFSTFKERFIFK